MKISFEGETLREIVEQIEKFTSSDLFAEKNVVKEAVEKAEAKPKHVLNRFKKAAAKKEAEEKKAVVVDVEPPPQEPEVHSAAAVAITKADLSALLQKICEKASDNTAGIMQVRDIFRHFGIAKLGELDEKRYHEMHKHVSQILA